MTDIILLATFLLAGVYSAAAIRRKLPLLLQVPQQLIEESFITRPSRLRRQIAAAEWFFRSRSWKKTSRRLAVNVLTQFRLWLLRTERRTFQLLETLQNAERDRGMTNGQFLGELKQWRQEEKQNGTPLPETVLNPEAPPISASNRGGGVGRRKTSLAPKSERDAV